MVRAIKTRQIDFLYSVFAFNKNYEELTADDSEDEAEKDDDVLSKAPEKKRYMIFTFDWLFKHIVEFC